MSKVSHDYNLPDIATTVAELNVYGSVIVSSLYFLVVAIVLVIITQKLARKFLYPRLARKRHAIVFILTLHALVLLVAFLLVLGRLGFDISVIGPAALLIVIVLAILIFLAAPFLPELPFKIGNMVEIEGILGNVNTITPIFTHVQTFDGRMVFIPNTTVWAKSIVNYHSTPARRVELELHVSADHSFTDARAVLMDIMHSDTRVLDDPAPDVRINAARAEGIDMVGLCWVNNEEFLDARSDLYGKVIEAVQSDAGISLALKSERVELSGEVTSR